MATSKWEGFRSRQWNLVLRMANDNRPREDAEKILNKDELELYDSAVAELAEMRKDHPGAAFWPVETDW